MLARDYSLECGGLTPLWPVAAWRDHAEPESSHDCGAGPPQAKAPTRRRIPRRRPPERIMNNYGLAKLNMITPVTFTGSPMSDVGANLACSAALTDAGCNKGCPD